MINNNKTLVMPNSPKQSIARISRALAAWETLRPKKTFAGLTLEQFRKKLQPSFDARAALVQIENQRAALQNQRDSADEESLKVVQHIVNAVKGDFDEGENSDLYEAMGFVRRSERKSGLKRARKLVPIEKAA